MSIQEIKKKIVPILKKEGATKAGIFGSFARGEEKKNSDVDILVELPSNVSLLGMVGLQTKLENVLGRSVDLVEYCVIKSRIKKGILEEEVRIL